MGGFRDSTIVVLESSIKACICVIHMFFCCEVIYLLPLLILHEFDCVYAFPVFTSVFSVELLFVRLEKMKRDGLYTNCLWLNLTSQYLKR